MPIAARERNETGAVAVVVAGLNVLKGIEK